ncbi:CLUMA_CG006940, isoform A [Clunio marinus]|uniref:CLUMA_CG006940, isoform A n=1 Tax=Clunio marinus TaxID=568069 RepID=A0A1J1I1D4_9DIPT|nr:CLUMA_CG006940, isoform A [Clunio marinus]
MITKPWCRGIRSLKLLMFNNISRTKPKSCATLTNCFEKPLTCIDENIKHLNEGRNFWDVKQFTNLPAV